MKLALTARPLRSQRVAQKLAEAIDVVDRGVA